CSTEDAARASHTGWPLRITSEKRGEVTRQPASPLIAAPAARGTGSRRSARSRTASRRRRASFGSTAPPGPRQPPAAAPAARSSPCGILPQLAFGAVVHALVRADARGVAAVGEARAVADVAGAGGAAADRLAGRAVGARRIAARRIDEHARRAARRGGQRGQAVGRVGIAGAERGGGQQPGEEDERSHSHRPSLRYHGAPCNARPQPSRARSSWRRSPSPSAPAPTTA